MNDIKSTRDGFGEAIVEIGSDDRVVVLDADLSESTRSIKFKEKYPDRFFELGISEQDMIGTAAGLAASGKSPFACSFAVFITGNAYAQIRLHAGISKLNMRLVGSHAGILTGEDGASHQALEDISMMRSIPGMAVIQPADYIEAREATKSLLNINLPVYLRLGRTKLPIINRENYRFEFGKGVELRNGNDVTLIATGSMVNIVMKSAEQLAKENINARVINIHTIKPIDKDIILKAANETKAIVTAEDHNIIGGLGSAVAEVLAENHPLKIKRIGVNDQFGQSGKPDELYREYSLTKEAVINAAKSLLKDNDKDRNKE